MTTINDLKIYGLNTIAMAFNFTQIDLTLKLLLTAVAIGYTLQKWYIMNEERKLKKELKKQEDAAKGKALDNQSSKNTIVKNGIVRKTKEVRNDIHAS